MAKKQDPYAFFKTRLGFYSLVLLTVSSMLTALNLYGYSNFEEKVLGENDRSEALLKEFEEEKRAEKERHEIEKREGQKIRLQQKYNVEAEKLRIKYERENDELIKKVELENKERVLRKEEEEKLIEEVENNLVEAEELEIASDESKIVVKKDRIKVRTGFPLSLDASTNQLTVTRPDGTVKTVSVLPDEAVANFIRHKKINLINFEDPGTGTGSGEIDDTGSESAELENETQIELVEYDDQLAYEIKGKKKLKFLGLIPITTDTTGYVSAETGDVLAQEESLFTRFLNILSL